MTFLPKETIENPSALAAIFEQMLEAYNKRKVPMTDEQTRYSINIMMADESAIDEMYNKFKDTFPIGGFFLRCGLFPIKYQKRLLVWLGLMTYTFGIGGMILIGYWLQWRVCELKEKYITVKNEIENEGLSLNIVCEKIFPFGIFNEELVHEFWDRQKVSARPDNLVDHLSCQLSFMKQAETSISAD